METEIEKREFIKLLQRTRGDFHAVLISQHQNDYKKQAQSFIKMAERINGSAMVLSMVSFD